jgi:hypothetical protein
MELFTAGNESQLQTIMRWIDESDIYVLLLGGRYGSLEPSSGLSYTEVEYDYAVSQKKPYFSIVITEPAIDEKLKRMGKDSIETAEPKKLTEFRKKVLDNISSFYSESKDIKLAIHETLQDFKERYNFSGWVSGKSMEVAENLLEENRTLRLKIEELNSVNEKAFSSEIKTAQKSEESNENAEFEDLYKIFSNMKISSDKLYGGSAEVKEYSILKLLMEQKSIFVNGVNNRFGMQEWEKVYFFNVFPKLAVHELAENLALEGVRYRLFRLSKKGLRFLAFIDKKNFGVKK